jgi:hypothetical protein
MLIILADRRPATVPPIPWECQPDLFDTLEGMDAESIFIDEGGE